MCSAECRPLVGELPQSLFELFAIDCGDDVTDLDACLCRWAVGLDAGHQRSFQFLQAKTISDVFCDWLDRSADVAPLNKSAGCFNCATTAVTVVAGMANPMPTDPPDGEKMAVLTPMTRPFMPKVGPPNAPIDSRVDLSGNHCRDPANIASLSGNDPGGHGSAEAEWVAHRNDPLAGLGKLIGKRDVRERVSSTFRRARSVLGSVPTTFASGILPSSMTI